jgi:hypothetical protein
MVMGVEREAEFLTCPEAVRLEPFIVGIVGEAMLIGLARKESSGGWW